MFGNLDDMKYSRSMVTAVASKAVDLLFIQTETLYHLVKDYPVVQTRLRKHILLENMVRRFLIKLYKISSSFNF